MFANVLRNLPFKTLFYTKTLPKTLIMNKLLCPRTVIPCNLAERLWPLLGDTEVNPAAQIIQPISLAFLLPVNFLKLLKG